MVLKMFKNLYNRFRRLFINFYPVFRSTGAWVTYISKDLREVHIRLPLSWRTRNYVGTLFGGALYSAVDGIPMVMLIELLERKYIVWDKSAKIRFIKPGKGTVTAIIKISKEETDEIINAVAFEGKTERVHHIVWKDKDENTIAIIEQTIYIKAISK